MNQFYKNLALWLIIGLIMVGLFQAFNGARTLDKSIVYSDFMRSVDQGQISEVLVQGNNIRGRYLNGKIFETYAPKDPNLISTLRQKGVRISAEPAEQNSWYMNLLLSWFPMLVLIGVWIFFMRQMQMGGSKALSFGKSKARLVPDDSKKKITFKDVAGIEEAKSELEELVDFLREPPKFTRLGARIPKGVLLVGPPGTGKTLLAKAIAGEADVPFFQISGSSFVEMFVGVGASRVRDLFEQGKINAPCIIFIDEIDAVGRHRGAGLGGGHDEREQTLNQLLVEMDGFESNDGVILVAATNRPDVLDPALLRPGRFDRQIVVSLPDINGRLQILHVHVKDIPLDDSVDLELIARGTPRFSGADLANLLNESALIAAGLGKNAVEMTDMTEAKDKVLMGKERRSLVLSEKEKENTAYHEAGHALVSLLTPGTDPVEKVTIIPRGFSLGSTWSFPEEDRYSENRTYLRNQLTILMGGRVAEMLVFDEMTTGAKQDIQTATGIARNMVCEWGMSDELGPLAYGKKDDQIFLGKDISQSRDYSDSIALSIDKEVKDLVTSAYDRAMNLLKDNRDKLDLLAKALLEYETLDRDDINTLLDSGEVPISRKKKFEATRKAASHRPSSEQEAPPRPQEGSRPSPPDLAPGQA
ncbi:MAG: ATP-dependent metallopeptidase FtsH/Yme1/Tma family protein [Nitrospinaceae bacterium]|nr:ATP-dependent metallopeptidase FtsH/Yme1/Tma family protein [Nitrospinaceae bacterium]MBT3823090.1 ATP-dependent metallopeptidase FtsH/Yme1/Tma family protein [Nitrospinaceae bacterium]MBT4432283.1 ATP-dependent metallopeptidase FtsH/Yme1/Tma family protein [Nitrospinaceae bacterium]MBT5367974.1 ATP-dependent metallopeptidase FtsH/Yme1/Tma family protein [Nitrospinaceae bacterium]MBT5948083.1 ATP-dependent metallopeptidase FtsH/Yme1/Tma family protein [Nitrospinaceae bacterium]